MRLRRPTRLGWLGIGAALTAVGLMTAALVLGVRTERTVATVPVPSPSSAAVPQPTAAAATGVATRADPDWVRTTSDRTGIPQRALAAYAGVSLAMADEDPGCRLAWTTLAGIGEVESAHGTLHGGRITDDGRQEPALFGIPLDGRTTARIADTDDGALDRDTTWDRAVGPMQFIPSTWRLYAADGDGDGTSDPQHLHDATLAAGRYLCAVGGDLSRSSRWIAAVAAYNASVDYNNRVVAVANRLAAATR